MIAQSERLILRRYIKEDLQDLFESLSDQEVVKYELYKPLMFHEAKEYLEWYIETDEMIVVELKDSHKMIGNVYFWKDESGNAIWKDTYVYARLNDRNL